MKTKKITNWVKYVPHFDYHRTFQDYKMHDCGWFGHVFFAYDLVRNIKPSRIVELGTYKGTSFFSFLQAVKDGGLNSEVFAIDSWEGDEHAGFYGDELYENVKNLVRIYYSDTNARLLRKRFEEALKEFEDGSIDILHIDGLHTYEAVKNDYETWKRKLTPDGVILFHDISVADFGVWKLWNELKENNTNSFFYNFNHSYGLGVEVLSSSTFFGLEESLVSDFRTYYEYMFKSYVYDRIIRVFYDLYNQYGEGNALKDQFAAYHHEILAARSELEHTRLMLENVISNGDLKSRQTIEELQKENLYYKGYIKTIKSRKFFKLYQSILNLFGKKI